MTTTHKDSAELINSHEWVYVLDDVMQTESEALEYLWSNGFTAQESFDYLFLLIQDEKVRQLRARREGLAEIPPHLERVWALAYANSEAALSRT